MMHVYDDILFSLGTVGWWALEISREDICAREGQNFPCNIYTLT